MTEVGGQLRCDGRTLKYETVVGYLESEELWDTFRESERGRGRIWEELCSARYAPQKPAAAAAAHKCPKLS